MSIGEYLIGHIYLDLLGKFLVYNVYWTLNKVRFTLDLLGTFLVYILDIE